LAQAQEKLEQTSVKISNAADTIKASKEGTKQNWVDIMDAESGKQKMNVITNLAKEVLNNQKQLSVERDEREKNIIVFGVEDKDKKVESPEEDKAFFKTMCLSALELDEAPEVKIIRIKDSNPNHTRPIKVTFDSIWNKRKFLSSLFRLKGLDKYRNVRVAHDMCIADREENRKLLQEAYKKNQEEKPTSFKYKVRGPPWAMKIIKVSLQKN
jgi:hypothetical protein